MKRKGLIFCWLILMLSCSDAPRQETSQSAVDTSTAKPSNGQKKKRILFFGDSLTAGYGLEDPSDAFPGRIRRIIDSLGLPWEVVASGLSGETSAGGAARIDWVASRGKVDILVLELGANDGLRGVSPKETQKNLQSIIDQIRQRYPDVRLVMAGMQSPPNMGKMFTDSFQSVFPAIARENDMELVPFLLEGVAGDPTLNQADGIHPTQEGHRLVAENVWKLLGPMLK
jgi:acyl-CoA thioesterase-1